MPMCNIPSLRGFPVIDLRTTSFRRCIEVSRKHYCTKWIDLGSPRYCRAFAQVRMPLPASVPGAFRTRLLQRSTAGWVAWVVSTRRHPNESTRRPRAESRAAAARTQRAAARLQHGLDNINAVSHPADSAHLSRIELSGSGRAESRALSSTALPETQERTGRNSGTTVALGKVP